VRCRQCRSSPVVYPVVVFFLCTTVALQDVRDGIHSVCSVYGVRLIDFNSFRGLYCSFVSTEGSALCGKPVGLWQKSYRIAGRNRRKRELAGPERQCGTES